MFPLKKWFYVFTFFVILPTRWEIGILCQFGHSNFAVFGNSVWTRHVRWSELLSFWSANFLVKFLFIAKWKWKWTKWKWKWKIWTWKWIQLKWKRESENNMWGGVSLFLSDQPTFMQDCSKKKVKSKDEKVTLNKNSSELVSFCPGKKGKVKTSKWKLKLQSESKNGKLEWVCLFLVVRLACKIPLTKKWK